MQTHRISRHGLELQHFPAPDSDVVICRNPYSAIEELASTDIIRGLQTTIFPANGLTPQQWSISSYGVPAADGENPEPREDTRTIAFGPTENTQAVREIEITLHNETSDPAAESSLVILAAPEEGLLQELCTLVAIGSQSRTFRIPFGDDPRIISVGLNVSKADNAVINATVISQ